MKILTSAYTLDLSGVPTSTLTMYKELVKRGHEVTVYSPSGGKLEVHMKVVRKAGEAKTPEVVIAQNNICAAALKAAFPKTPFIFYSHSIWVDAEQPPNFSAERYLAINETVAKNMQYKGINIKKISIVRDFVDIERFSPQNPINHKLQKVLFISNYKKWNNFKAVSAACNELKVNLRCVGSPYGRSEHVEEEINQADLIISWGRGIIEAMACGRAVVSFDKLMGDGYIDEENYFRARRDNFCGYLSQRDFKSVEELVAEISKYTPDSSHINRKLAVEHHDVKEGVDQILEVVEQIV